MDNKHGTMVCRCEWNSHQNGVGNQSVAVPGLLTRGQSGAQCYFVSSVQFWEEYVPGHSNGCVTTSEVPHWMVRYYAGNVCEKTPSGTKRCLSLC